MPEPETRPYRKRKRAEAEEETRRRITEAAVELHGTVGPLQATVTDVAKRAGVSRMTVYNHFPTEVELFTACSTHWAESNPFPDPGSWTGSDPEERLCDALEELYEWYGLKRAMLGNVLADLHSVPALAEVKEGLWTPWVDAMVEALAEGWSAPDVRSFKSALRLAVAFNTWRILTESGLEDPTAAALMARLVSGLGGT